MGLGFANLAFNTYSVMLLYVFLLDKDTEETLNSHMFFTIHVYQSRVDKIAGKMGGENLKM